MDGEMLLLLLMLCQAAIHFPQLLLLPVVKDGLMIPVDVCEGGGQKGVHRVIPGKLPQKDPRCSSHGLAVPGPTGQVDHQLDLGGCERE